MLLHQSEGLWVGEWDPGGRCQCNCWSHQLYLLSVPLALPSSQPHKCQPWAITVTFKQHGSEKGRGRDSVSRKSFLPASSSRSFQCPTSTFPDTKAVNSSFFLAYFCRCLKVDLGVRAPTQCQLLSLGRIRAIHVRNCSQPPSSSSPISCGYSQKIPLGLCFYRSSKGAYKHKELSLPICSFFKASYWKITDIQKKKNES